MQCSAVGPPENIVRVHIGFPMAGITAPAGRFPETAQHLLAADIAPAVLDVAFIGDFIHNDGLMVFFTPLIHQLRGFVNILPLNAAMSDPGPAVIVHPHAVMDGTQMAVRILFTQNRAVTLPVLRSLIFH